MSCLRRFLFCPASIVSRITFVVVFASLIGAPIHLLAQSYVYEWAWMAGSDTQDFSASFGWPGVYGELGQFSENNRPSAREFTTSWTDKQGRLWLFGGFGSDSTVNYGDLNDLWVFDPSLGPRGEWAWMSGNKTINCLGCARPAVYGQLGKFAASNDPGGRIRPVSWTDRDGKLWMFGGWYVDSNNREIDLNDLWEFDPARGIHGQWAWMGGSNTHPSPCSLGYCGQAGTYGERGQFAAMNVPGARDGASGVVDASGSLLLFGGTGFDANGTFGQLNDVWKFDPSIGSLGEWAWMAGRNTVPGVATGWPGVYGEKGGFAATNNPGGRNQAAMWIDGKGNLWFFGGSGFDSTANWDNLNDLWEFDPTLGKYGEWAWITGSSKPDSAGATPGVYGTLGQFSDSNVPGGRFGSIAWTGKDGGIWLFGGQGDDSAGAHGDMNDLWRFDPARGTHGEWAWMGGSSMLPATCQNCGEPGRFGPLGQFAASNDPGGRDSGASWVDADGNFWLYGGGGYFSNLDQGGVLNDLWEYKRFITQSIVFRNVPTSVTFSSTPITLSATGGASGEPLVFSVVSGPGKLSGAHGAVLTTTDKGTIVVAANQAGNSDYLAAPQAKHTILVKPAGTVAMPTIKPGTGVYTSSQSVTIDDSAVDAKVYYTTDGSTPSATHGTLYKSPFTVSKSETVKAIALLPGYNPSVVAKAQYTIH